jgi:two-component system response regulator FixJ
MTFDRNIEYRDGTKKCEKRVYAVDDGQCEANSLLSMFKAAGYTVVARASAETLLNAIEVDPPAPRTLAACAVLNVHLAKIDELRLKERLPGRFGLSIPVIIVTDYATVPLAVQAMRNGAVDIIPKPYKPDRVLAAVADAQATYRARDALNRLIPLAESDHKLLRGLVEGKSSKVIARDFGISPRTVDSRRAALMERLDVRGRVELFQLALWAGMI